MVEMACELFPQLKHHIDYVEFSTPLTNNYYFSQQYVSTFIQDSKRTYPNPGLPYTGWGIWG